ncbi:MAG: CDGSH iron-sulfur domain-containing protein [Magnetococcales bacterium]|nr:CDGSH iron-sulfur domain-containing protein [Magnetococcales bacterium]
MSGFNRDCPFPIKASKGVTMDICTCGNTDTPPLCDCSHQSHIEPFSFTPNSDDTLEVCGCGKSGSLPWCDNSHSDCL